MTETWKDIKGYEDSHQLSSEGRVRTKDRVIKCFMGKRKYKGQLLKIIHDRKEPVYRIGRENSYKEFTVRQLRDMV